MASLPELSLVVSRRAKSEIRARDKQPHSLLRLESTPGDRFQTLRASFARDLSVILAFSSWRVSFFKRGWVGSLLA